MSTQSVMSEFRTAYELGRSKKAEELVVNPILDIIQSFVQDKRVIHFEEDLQTAINDSGLETLTDANQLQESAAALDEITKLVTRMKSQITKRADQIIEQRQAAGITQEGVFEIYPLEKKTNRKVNRAVLLSEKFKKRYDLLLKTAVKDFKETYTPTIAVVEATFGEDADEILIPGSVQVVGYNIRLIAPMPEQASIEVEP
ncbi:MAG TPA: hypothetical protein VN372_05295 [Methanospirillum sp.]|nr:hypothetical protein [Methanospirillum sp.]